jgi:hypothetical protein
VLHASTREADGRADAPPSMVVIDAHLARGRPTVGSPSMTAVVPNGRTRGAKRVVAVDATGLPVGALVVPASTHENRASELMLEFLARQGVTGRLELVLVDRGVTAASARALGRHHDVEMRRVGWDTSSRCSGPSGTPGASRSPTAAWAVPAGWRSRTRTPPRPRRASSRSPALPPPCGTSHEARPSDDSLRWPREGNVAKTSAKPAASASWRRIASAAFRSPRRTY